MSRPTPWLPSRIALAFGSFFAIIGSAELAGRVARLRQGDSIPAAADDEAGLMPAAPGETVATAAPDAEAARPAPEPAAPVLREAPHESALQLLGLLQRDARLIDFVEEDMTAYADAEVGAAARIVHEGCRKVLREHFTLEPVRSEAEGSGITLAPGFDAAAVRVTGRVVGQPPFTGSLAHRGWRVSETRLPKLADSHDASIVAQAEVEL